MTVIKCDRCGKEIPDVREIFFVSAGKNYSRRDEGTHMELCEWCYKCLLDWVKEN